MRTSFLRSPRFVQGLVALALCSTWAWAGQPGEIGAYPRANCTGRQPTNPMDQALIVEPGLASSGIQLRSHFRDLNGACIHWVEAGAGNNKLIVLLHGYPQFWASWSKVLPPLVAQGYRVLMPDMRGVNESGHPPSPASYGQQTIARDVLTLIAHYRAKLNAPQLQAEVVAYDTGGMTGWYLAASPGDLISRISIVNFPHPGLYRRYLLLADREARNFSQFPLSFFVFGQAYIADLAIDYFLQEEEFSLLRGYLDPELVAEGEAYLADKSLPVSKIVAASAGGDLTYANLQAHDSELLQQYARRYAVVFHRLNYEMRWLRMGFDSFDQRPFRMVQPEAFRDRTFTLAEVKLYTDIIMRDFSAEESQLHDWFKFFTAMTAPAPNMGFLHIPADSFVAERGLRSAQDYGRWTAICSILERELPGMLDRQYGPYERSWMGAMVKVGQGVEAGMNVVGDPRIRFLAERFTKLFTNLNLGDWPDGVCQNQSLARGLNLEADPYRLPQIQIPVQMIWGYHDAYLNTENFFDYEKHAAFFADPERDLRLVHLGKAKFAAPWFVEPDVELFGSHWSIDEFPAELAEKIAAFAKEKVQ